MSIHPCICIGSFPLMARHQSSAGPRKRAPAAVRFGTYGGVPVRVGAVDAAPADASGIGTREWLVRRRQSRDVLSRLTAVGRARSCRDGHAPHVRRGGRRGRLRSAWVPSVTSQVLREDLCQGLICTIHCLRDYWIGQLRNKFYWGRGLVVSREGAVYDRDQVRYMSYV